MIRFLPFLFEHEIVHNLFLLVRIVENTTVLYLIFIFNARFMNFFGKFRGTNLVADITS